VELGEDNVAEELGDNLALLLPQNAQNVGTG